MRRLSKYAACVGNCPYAFPVDDEEDFPKSLLICNIPYTMVDSDPEDANTYIVEIQRHLRCAHTTLAYNSDEQIPQLQIRIGKFCLIFEKTRLTFTMEEECRCRHREDFGYALGHKKLRIPTRIRAIDAARYAHLFSLFIRGECECTTNFRV